MLHLFECCVCTWCICIYIYQQLPLGATVQNRGRNKITNRIERERAESFSIDKSFKRFLHALSKLHFVKVLYSLCYFISISFLYLTSIFFFFFFFFYFIPFHTVYRSSVSIFCFIEWLEWCSFSVFSFAPSPIHFGLFAYVYESLFLNYLFYFISHFCVTKRDQHIVIVTTGWRQMREREKKNETQWQKK